MNLSQTPGWISAKHSDESRPNARMNFGQTPGWISAKRPEESWKYLEMWKIIHNFAVLKILSLLWNKITVIESLMLFFHASSKGRVPY
ncbi:MAG: hypothetical protein LIP03_01435 [Bacteroidales bacterium]|nr:hypothetical protein [Bacteroidales bacterium]